MQSHGSLAEIPLRSLLEAAQGERSTGTLTVRNGNGESTTSLYFLFGHLFHAQGDGKAGDEAVVSARAGFRGKELSALWPTEGHWELHEQAVGLFSHCFVARRTA